MSDDPTEALRARYQAMTPEQKAAGWDAYYHLSDREWTLYQCSDCDPEYADEDNPDDPAHHYTVPAMMVLPEGIEAPKHCPRCGSYLGMGESRKVRVTTLGSSKELTP